MSMVELKKRISEMEDKNKELKGQGNLIVPIRS